jgi:hypothetical protein
MIGARDGQRGEVEALEGRPRQGLEQLRPDVVAERVELDG